MSDLHNRGVNGLCIVREDPELVTKNYNLKPDDVVLLSSQSIKGFKAINSLQEISITITKFLKSGGGVVLLHGLEYLISRFGFNTVYMCMQEKHIEFLEAGAVLLVPVNMETLDSKRERPTSQRTKTPVALSTFHKTPAQFSLARECIKEKNKKSPIRGLLACLK